MQSSSHIAPFEEARAVLERLTSGLAKHRILDNRFYRAWMAQPFTIDGLEIVVRNYGAFTRTFPDKITAIVLATDDLRAKTEHIKTLYSEAGNGDPDKVHWVLFDRFFSELAIQLGCEGRLDRHRLERDLELLPATKKLLDGEKALYGSPRPAIAAGAQLALEWKAYTSVRQLYEGARNYASLWSEPDEFHEACEWFYAHIGSVEKDHKRESMNAALRYATSQERLEEIVAGFRQHLEIFADMWDEVFDAIVAVDGLNNSTVHLRD
jgi:pyrroloquinoline quinone (PQQ) biosynthesis protein C